MAALAGLENHLRRQRGLEPVYGVADAVTQLVKFRATAEPNSAWRTAYQEGLRQFERCLRG